MMSIGTLYKIVKDMDDFNVRLEISNEFVYLRFKLYNMHGIGEETTESIFGNMKVVSERLNRIINNMESIFTEIPMKHWNNRYATIDKDYFFFFTEIKHFE